MPYDKAVDSAALDAGLTAIANAIREKAGSSGALAFPDAMAAAIAAIESGGGFDSNHVDIAYGSFVPATGVNYFLVDCGFPISKDDAFMYVYGCIPIATRTSGANIAGYFVNKMPSAALPDTAYGGTYYANTTATKLSSDTSGNSTNVDNVFFGTTGNNISLRGYGSWHFVPSNEYFWIVVKEKNT